MAASKQPECTRSLVARVHSFQSLGAVDGPGIRFVIFMQGCPYRCPWCHNPDTQAAVGGTEYSLSELLQRAERYRPYFAGGGGVTISGGEPLLQQEFVAAYFEELHRIGISTALDTAGRRPNDLTVAVLRHTDTVLCDLKFPTDEAYKKNIGLSLDDVLEFLRLCASMNKQVVIRHVVVPTVTDSEESIREISRLAHSILPSPKLELLPFRKLCISKYEKLGIPFPMAHLPECDAGVIERLRRLL